MLLNRNFGKKQIDSKNQGCFQVLKENQCFICLSKSVNNTFWHCGFTCKLLRLLWDFFPTASAACLRELILHCLNVPHTLGTIWSMKSDAGLTPLLPAFDVDSTTSWDSKRIYGYFRALFVQQAWALFCLRVRAALL